MQAEVKAFAKTQGRSAKHIFILQMPRNIVSLFKRFGRQRLQNDLWQTAKKR